MATITLEDIRRLEKTCMAQIECDEVYRLRNDAKLRAVITSKTYEEFKNVVDAAHMRPLTSYDKRNAQTKHKLWNSVSTL